MEETHDNAEIEVQDMFEDINCSICDGVTIVVRHPSTKLIMYKLGPQVCPQSRLFMACSLADFEEMTGYDTIYLNNMERTHLDSNSLPGKMIAAFCVVEPGTSVIELEERVAQLNEIYWDRLQGETLSDHLNTYFELTISIDSRIRQVTVH